MIIGYNDKPSPPSDGVNSKYRPSSGGSQPISSYEEQQSNKYPSIIPDTNNVRSSVETVASAGSHFSVRPDTQLSQSIETNRSEANSLNLKARVKLKFTVLKVRV